MWNLKFLKFKKILKFNNFKYKLLFIMNLIVKIFFYYLFHFKMFKFEILDN